MPAAIEAAFQARTASYRARLYRKLVGPSLLIYNLLLVVDFLVLPDTFGLACLIHFGIVTPLIVCAAWLIARRPSFLIREFMTLAVPFGMLSQVLLIYALNRELPNAEEYQYLGIMIVAFMSIIQRPDFRFAVGGATFMSIMYIGVLLTSGASYAVCVIGVTGLALAAYLSLSANYRMEVDARYAFLLRQQDRFKRENAEALAFRDPLTGLGNRRQLQTWIERFDGRSDAAPMSAAALLLDVDYFKQYNDHYGHLAGDLCLKRIAGALIANLRHEDDLAVRFGGEEFLMLASGMDQKSAVQIGERLRRMIEGFAIPHCRSSTSERVVTASVGVMAGALGDYSIVELITGADRALYRAKSEGRNRIFPPLISTAAVRTDRESVSRA